MLSYRPTIVQITLLNSGDFYAKKSKKKKKVVLLVVLYVLSNFEIQNICLHLSTCLRNIYDFFKQLLKLFLYEKRKRVEKEKLQIRKKKV